MVLVWLRQWDQFITHMNSWAQCSTDELDFVGRVDWFLNEHPFDHEHIWAILRWGETIKGIDEWIKILVETIEDNLFLVINEFDEFADGRWKFVKNFNQLVQILSLPMPIKLLKQPPLFFKVSFFLYRSELWLECILLDFYTHPQVNNYSGKK